jgi:hypothetical protein
VIVVDVHILVLVVPSVNTVRFRRILFSSTEFSFTQQAFRDGCVIGGRLGKIALNTIQHTNFIHKHGYLRLKTKIVVYVCVCMCVCVCVCVDVRKAY